MTVTGFLHPGAMGSAVAAACSGSRLWASDGRSEATRRRAEAAGLVDAGTLDALVGRAEAIVSICPPDQAIAVARSVADAGFDGIYVDANAVSPRTAHVISEIQRRFVDGGIIGPPPIESGTTRLYLAGPDAASIASLWEGSILDARVLDGEPGAASALKMAYAAWTKGTGALLLAVAALADDAGVLAALRHEWQLSIPELPTRSERTAPSASRKAWRFAGEMEEIADTFADSDLPDGFHRAAAEVYRRMAAFKDADPPPDLAAVIAALLD